MNEDQKREVGERLENTLLLSLETVVDVLAEVISGERRIAVKTSHKNGETLHELILVDGPKVVLAVAGFEELKNGIVTLKERKGVAEAKALLERHLPEGEKLADLGRKPELWPAVAAELNELLGSWRLSEAEIEAISDPV